MKMKRRTNTLIMINFGLKRVLFLLISLAILPLSKIGAQELLVIKSHFLKCDDSVLVFTPADFSSEKMGETPALFLLHGWSGNYKNWSEKTDIQAMSDKYGFIIITPDGFYNSWYLNNIDKEKMQWRSFFDNELYPIISKKYKLNPGITFITGLSMGGHGAINIFLDDTTRFAAAGSMSGVMNLRDTRLKETEIPKILGPYSIDNELYDTQSAVYRLDSVKGIKKLMIITCGSQDYLAKSSRDFAERCEQLGIPNMLIMSPGVHSWPYWIFMLDQHLFIFDRIARDKGLGY